MTKPDERPGAVVPMEYKTAAEIAAGEKLQPGSTEKVTFPDGIPGSELDSGAATIGQVLKADGAGGAYWGADAAGVLTVGAQGALYGNDVTGNYRGAYAIDIQTGRAADGNVASGVQAITIGYDIQAGNRAIAIGSKPLLGPAGFAQSDYSLAVGCGAAVNDGPVAYNAVQAIAIGRNALVSAYTAFADNAVAIGPYAIAYASSVIAIGASAYASAANGCALGANSNARGLRSIALGYNSYAGSDDAVAIGPGVNNSNTDTVMLGVAATSFIEFNDFTPTAGTPTPDYYFTVRFNGGTYQVPCYKVP